MVSLDLGTPPSRQRSPDYQLGVGRVLGRTFAVTFANLPSFLLGALVVHSPGLALQVLAALPIGGAAALVLSIAHVVVSTVLSLLLSVALTFASSGTCADSRPRSPKRCGPGWGASRRCSWSAWSSPSSS
jgi:hypothetical protein